MQLFENDLRNNPKLLRRLPSLSGRRLICTCPLDQACHVDVIIRLYHERVRGTTRDGSGPLLGPPQAPEDRDDTSSDDQDGVARPRLGAGHWGRGSPLTVTYYEGLPRRCWSMLAWSLAAGASGSGTFGAFGTAASLAIETSGGIAVSTDTGAFGCKQMYGKPIWNGGD